MLFEVVPVDEIKQINFIELLKIIDPQVVVVGVELTAATRYVQAVFVVRVKHSISRRGFFRTRIQFAPQFFEIKNFKIFFISPQLHLYDLFDVTCVKIKFPCVVEYERI